MSAIRRLYDWTLSLARGRHAPAALGVISFVESSFFPIPPDIMLIPMVIANRKDWWKLALICTFSSVLGALLGYAIGAVLYETVGKSLIDFYHAQGTFDKLKDWYDQWGALGVLAGAVTPLPYKVLTIFSGTVQFSLPMFVLVSVIGRGLRFFLVAGLLYFFGEPIQNFIEKRLTLVFIAFVVMLVGGFVALKFLS